jgi:hypothetical protein
MKLSELTNSQVDEAIPLIPAAALAGRAALPYALRGLSKLKNVFKGAPKTKPQSSIIDPATGQPFASAASTATKAAPKAAPNPAVSAADDVVAAAPKEPGMLSKSASYALRNPGKTYLGYRGTDAAMDDDPFAQAFTRGVSRDVSNVWKGLQQGLKGDDGKKAIEPPKEEPAAQVEPAKTQEPRKYLDLEPEDDSFPDLSKKEQIEETLSSILKLSGQKSITERDNIVGLIKPKKIETLNESAQIAECGGIMPQSSSPSQPATLNISATASNGDEVANMLKSIMQLAGVKPVSHDMMPMGDMLPSIKPLQVMKGTLEDNVAEEACGDCGSNPCECAMEETYDNTPEERVEPYDPNNMAHVINKVASKDLASTPYQSASNPMSETKKDEADKKEKVDEDVYSGLFRAYQEFKNRQ